MCCVKCIAQVLCNCHSEENAKYNCSVYFKPMQQEAAQNGTAQRKETETE